MTAVFPSETEALWTGPGAPPPGRRAVASQARNTLLRHGYRSTASLTAATAANLTAIRTFGAGCLAETRRVLAAHGLHLAGEDDDAS